MVKYQVQANVFSMPSLCLGFGSRRLFKLCGANDRQKSNPSLELSLANDANKINQDHEISLKLLELSTNSVCSTSHIH